MSSIRIQVTGQETVDRVNKILSGIPGGAEKAIRSASKRAGETAKTRAGQFAASEYTVNKGTFMSETKTKLRISEGFTLSFEGSVLPLKRFRTRDARPKGVLTSVKRGQASGLKHVFIGSNGHFFERVGKSRFPIEKKFGPSTGHMMQNDKVIEQMDKTITETFDKRIEVEINRLLAGF